jgi:LruC domain-containing protein
LRSALAQDADQDGIPNAQDVFPCDARASAAAFGPAEGVFGLRIVEDQWPSAGDYDFNDGVVAYNLAARQDAAGRTTRLQATFDLVAAGGDYDNGLALQLPVPAAALASATVDAGGGPVPVSPSGADAELTVVVVPDLRAALGGARGPINSRPDRLAQPILRVTLALDFATPVDLPMGLAPFDLFVFRVQDPSLEIHRPQYAGTAAFDAARLGTQDDRSSPGLGFVDRQGVPFVLDLPVSAAYPAEGTPISSLYPDILTFGASGGAQAQDFYLTHVAATAAYQDAAGQPAPAPAALPTPAADTSCIREVVVSYTGAPLSFTVPAGVTQLEVKMWGSGGGGTYGGAGGYTAGLVPVTPGEVLGLEVGAPTIGPLPAAYQTYPSAGGRSALWRGNATSELLVAGGGGAGSSYSGGAGGGLVGQDSLGGPSTQCCFGQTSYPSGGGSQVRGGIAGCATSWSGHNTCGVAGGRNVGSRGFNNSLHQGGFGGGGYYGGASGGATAYSGAGGGGGSGFVGPTVIGGVTTAGNRQVPGNASDGERGTAGNPGTAGLVIIRY